MGAAFVSSLIIVDTDILIDVGLQVPDALIAATAISGNQPLISKNRRHYAFINSLELLPYP
jgi:hypothetical protein